MSFPDVWLNPRAQTLTSYAILGMSVEYAECMNLTVQELIQGLRKHFELLPAWITEVSPSDVDGKSGGKVEPESYIFRLLSGTITPLESSRSLTPWIGKLTVTSVLLLASPPFIALPHPFSGQLKSLSRPRETGSFALDLERRKRGYQLE
ncbi:MAG: hypothetical protein LQ339_006902 [Xanthoria mediterranea]|nr:MAG: hypothetical protein LQ339_006902 [Xanthoria mediterranea]